MRAAIKRLLPAPGPRRLPFGIARGLRLHVDFAVQSREYLGLYELELNRHLRRLCPTGTSVFDVGAHHGYDALVLARLGGGLVASFEADADCLASMRANIDLNPGLAERIEPVLGTVGRGGSTGTVALDAYVTAPAGFVPSFVKIDVDGAELNVIHGARTLLAEHRPSLVVEVHSEELEHRCGGLLVQHGYAPRIVNQRRLAPDYRPIQHNRWLVAAGRPR